VGINVWSNVILALANKRIKMVALKNVIKIDQIVGINVSKYAMLERNAKIFPAKLKF